MSSIFLEFKLFFHCSLSSLFFFFDHVPVLTAGEGELPEPDALKPTRPLNPIAKAVLLGRPDIGLLGSLNVGEDVTSGMCSSHEK